MNAFAGLVSNVSAVLEAMEKEIAARKSQHVRYCGQGKLIIGLDDCPNPSH